MTPERTPTNDSILYKILLERLTELKDSTNSEIVRFPAVFKKLCRNFSITKEDCWSLLFLLQEKGFIEIVPYHGIKIRGHI